MNRMKFCVLAVISYLIGQQLAYAANWPVLYAIVTLPGTFLHELAHYGVAYVLGGAPYGFSVVPTWNAGGMDSLGHVMIHPNWYNSAPTGLAPFMLAPLTAMFLAFGAKTRSIWWTLKWTYFASCAWAACVPSSADLSIAASYPQSWPIAAVMLGFTGWFTWRVVRRVTADVQ